MELVILVLLLLIISPVDLIPGVEVDDMGYATAVIVWFITSRFKKKWK